MKKTNFIKWIEARPALSVSMIEKDANLPPTTLQKYIKGHRALPEKYKLPVINQLKRYGYNDKNL